VPALAGNAFAIDWDNGGIDNLWRNPENWAGDVVPDNSTDASTSLEGEPNRIVIDASHTGADEAKCDDLNIGEGPTGTPCYLYVTGGSFIPDNDWRVGYNKGNGVVEISGGTITQGTAGDRFLVGRKGGTGRVLITGGDLSFAEDWRIAYQYADSNGIVTIAGGTVRTGRVQGGGDVWLARGLAGPGDANVYGELNIHDGEMYIGGSVEGDAGGNLYIADRGGSVGVFNMTGGYLFINDDFQLGRANQWAEDWDTSYARAYITGGTIDVDGGNVQIGYRPINDAELRLGGTAVVNVTDDFMVGRDTSGGYGRFYMTGGELNIGDDFRVGDDADSSGWAYLEAGTITIDDDIGRNIDANETVIEMNDPMLVLFNNEGATSSISEFLANDWLYYGGWDTTDKYDDRHFVYDYDVRNFEQTTLTARGASQIDYLLAWGPKPRNYQNTQPSPAQTITLEWKPGDGTDPTKGRDVYFGTKFDEVNDASIGNDPHGTRLGRTTALEWPDVPVEMKKTYYWRVDEVLPGNQPYKGEIWRFHCQMWIPIEDFERYEGTEWDPDDEDDPDHEGLYLRDVWVDYFVDEAYGAIIKLHQAGPRKGNASMELQYMQYGWFYDWSEAYLPLVPDQNWSSLGLKAIRLSYYGDPTNTLEPDETLYIVLRDSNNTEEVMPCPQDPCRLLPDDVEVEEKWYDWNIAMEDFTEVDINHIAGLYIGVGHRGTPITIGSEGHVYIDDIRLYIPRCVRGDPDGDTPYLNPYGEFVGWPSGCMVDWVDLDTLTDEWLDHDYAVDVNYQLVGHWDFNESSGETAADSSGKDHDGTLRNMDANTCWQSGYYGNALFFDPCGDISDPCDPLFDPSYNGADYVAIPHSDDYDWTGEDLPGQTWSAWVKTNPDPRARWNWYNPNAPSDPCMTIMGKGDANELPPSGLPHSYARAVSTKALGLKGPQLCIQMNKKRTFSDPCEDTRICDLNDGYWHHVAMTVSFQTGDGDNDDEIQLWLEGTADSYGYKDTDDVQRFDDPNDRFYIGAKMVGWFHFYSGWIDDVQIFNYPLDADQINTVMHGGTVPNTQAEIYYDLDSERNLYDEEPTNKRAINYKDFAMMADWWLMESLWPNE